MGNTAVSYHVRCEPSDTPKLTSVCDTSLERAYLSKSINGWATIIDEESESMDEQVFEHVLRDLSKSAGLPVVLLFVYDSNSMGCYLAQNGKIVYRFECDMDGKLSQTGNRESLTRLADNADAADRLALPLDSEADKLPPPKTGRPTRAREIVREYVRFKEVAEALGVSWAADRYGFATFESLDELPDFGHFEEIKKNAKRFKRVGKVTG